MCVGCNNAAALLISSTLLANQLRECAISPDFAIGTIARPRKTGAPHDLDKVRQLPCPSVLCVAKVTSPAISAGAASMAADRVKPAAGTLGTPAPIPPRYVRKHELPGRLAPSARPNRRKRIGAATGRLSVAGQDHADSSDFMPGRHWCDAAVRICGGLSGWATTPVCPASFRPAASIRAIATAYTRPCSIRLASTARL
jgi:hypothetical protein